MRRALSAIAVAILLSAPALRAQYKPGPQVLTFFSSVDDSEQPYALYLPKDFSSAKRYPLVMMLHGAYSNHRLALRRVFGKGNQPGEDDFEATRYFPPLPDVEYIVAAPLARGTLGYQGIPEKDVMDVMSDVESRFAVDPDRVYLTGLSMGGGGTLWIGLTHPDIWAAIAPVCAASPPHTADLAPNALDLAVHFFQGGADPVVPVQQTRDWVSRLKGMDTKDVEYNEYPGVKHNSWDNAYANAEIFEWLGHYKRDLWPKRVRFASMDYEHRKAYWVVLDRLTPGTLASIDAQFTGPNQIEVKTSALRGFTLALFHHPSFEAGKPLAAMIDGQLVRVPPIASNVSFAKTSTGWRIGDASPGDGEKQAGAEGPLVRAFSDRHVYVFGTNDHPAKDELTKRREQAVQDAAWAPLGVRLELWLRTVADKDVRPSDWKSSDLILLGTKDTNSIVAGLSNELPMELSGQPSGWNLTYIWPHQDHYVVVSSGDGLGAQGRHMWAPWIPVTNFIAAVYGLPDYALFHHGQKVVEGRFDEHWKIAAADAEKLKNSGVVTLRKGAVQ